MYQLHELLRAFGRHHGEMLNSSAVARTLGTTRLQVGRLLRRLRGAGYLRLLPALPEPCPPDMIRRPRLYLRGRGWKEAFAATAHPGGCLRVPVAGELAARITEGVIARETTGRRRGSRFYSMGRYRRRGVDLVVSRASGRRIGFCFEPRGTGRHCGEALRALREAVEAGWIDSAILVMGDGCGGMSGGGTLCLAAPLLLAMYSEWTSELTDRDDLVELLQWLDFHPGIYIGRFCNPEEPMGLDGWYFTLEEDWIEAALLRPP